MGARVEVVEAALTGVVRGGVLLAVVWLCMRGRVRVAAATRVVVWSLVALAMIVLCLPVHRVLPSLRSSVPKRSS